MERQDLLKIGVLGLGNGGGNVADFASAEGFDAVAVNAATKDLDRLQNNVIKFPIGDGKGTGKNREEAKAFLNNHIGILEDIKMVEFINSHDVITVVSSTGGGFGSGASIELAKKIHEKYPNKCIIPVGIFPFDDEGYTAHEHSVEWLLELKECDEFGYMYYDNNRFASRTPEEVCDLINCEIVTAFKIFRGDYTLEDRTGGVDPRDMLTTLSVPGRIVAYLLQIEEADIINDSLVETILASIKDESGNAELVQDKQIMASVFQYCLHNQFRSYVPSIKHDLQEICGEHLNDYSNYSSLTDDDDTQDCISLIMSGLSDPTLRIDRLINKRDKLANDIPNRKAAQSKLAQAGVGNSKLQLGAKSFATNVAPKKVPVPGTTK